MSVSLHRNMDIKRAGRKNAGAAFTESERFFSEKGMGFPHEIGMFLGYPVADIRGFIENEGRKYLMIGYWKVYSNLSQARMIFKEYDRAKECAVSRNI